MDLRFGEVTTLDDTTRNESQDVLPTLEMLYRRVCAGKRYH